MPAGQIRVEMAGEIVAVHDLSGLREGQFYRGALRRGHSRQGALRRRRHTEAAARANLELLGGLGGGAL